MLRVVLPPLITAYIVFVGMVVLYLRRPVARSRGLDGSARARLGRVVRTTVGGYVAFLVIVLIFQVVLAGQPDAFAGALWGGAFLSAITLLVALVSPFIGRRSGRDRAGRRR
jgi:hypothetical protein